MTDSEMIQQEVSQEVELLLKVLFRGQRPTGNRDLEAMKLATRAA